MLGGPLGSDSCREIRFSPTKIATFQLPSLVPDKSPSRKPHAPRRPGLNHGYFLITQALDFADARRFVPGTHAGLLLARLRDPSRRALLERVEAVFRKKDFARRTA